MICFRTIRYKNILSVGNVFLEIELDSHKATLIVGQNGQGKSVILDALCFVLFGKPFRKINKPQLVNSINDRDMVVEIEFAIGSSEYKIRRGMKPNLFEIYLDGRMINQDSQVRDYQTYLEQNILKMNYKVFSQTVILGSANYVPFMQLPAAGRREIIEELLNIQIFSVMNTLLKESIQENKTNIWSADKELSVLDAKLELMKKHQKEMESLIGVSLDGLIQKQLDIDTKIAQAAIDIKALSGPTKPSYLNKFRADAIKLVVLKEQIERNVSATQKELSDLEANPVCNTCKQSLDVGELTKLLDEKRAKLNQLVNGIVSLNAKIAETDVQVKKAELVETEHNKLRATIAECNAELLRLNRDKTSIAQEITKCKESMKSRYDYSLSISNIEMDRNKNQNIRDGLVFDREVLGICASLLKDGGIKTKVIDQYVPMINSLINKYLNDMDFFVQFELNGEFKETIKSRYRDEFSYDSFSEGEKLRIDLALLFTWRALSKVRNTVSTNLLLFDEVLDSSLDVSGMEDFMKIISLLTKDVNSIIISHRDVMNDRFDRVLRFEKVKNFTRLAA